MKLSTTLPAALLSAFAMNPSSAFSLTMNGRSPLAAQYKSIMSIHRGITSGGSYPRMMAPPPGEPEPEVRF